MDISTILKLIHVLGAAVLFGTGAGIAFFLFAANRRRDVAGIAHTARLVVLADFIFTAPAVILQLVTGGWLIYVQGYDLMQEPWLGISLVLYCLVGACWLPVVWIQMNLRALADQALDTGSALPSEFHRKMKLWTILGFPAFSGVLVIFWLMIAKPEF